MKILALEFSSGERSVAILSAEGDRPAAILALEKETAKPGTSPLVLVQTALARAGLDRRAIDRVAVGLGPGSYTGIRSALAIAQGWQIARHVPVAGIPSFECLAFQTQQLNLLGLITFAVDAQRNELYLAQYAITPQEIQVRIALHLAPLAEAAASQVLVGPEAPRWHPNGLVMHPSAEALGRLAADREASERAEELEPIYLRETVFVKAPAPRLRAGD